jgi:putative SOS response-associated peptidase YedK
MCGRFTSTTPPALLAEQFVVDDVALDDDLEPRWNVAPTLPVLAVAASRSRGTRRLGTFRWGLVPSWAPDLSVGSRMINARAETVATKPAYAESLRRRRCIIPADSFYEWKVTESGRRQPYAVAAVDGRPMAFAGLWAAWRDPDVTDAPWVRTCVIITTAANSTLSRVHERMPVVLPQSTWDVWLDPDNDNAEGLVSMLLPAPSDSLHYWPVSTLVNKATNEGPELVEKVGDEAVEPELEASLFDPVAEH